MRFYTKQHKAYGGIELHARRMDVWILSQDGGACCIATGTPVRRCSSRLCPLACGSGRRRRMSLSWYGLADRCAREAMPLVWVTRLYESPPRRLGQQRYERRAADCRTPAGRPVATGVRLSCRSAGASDLLRRRSPLGRTRAARLTHVPHTNRPSTLPESGNAIAYKPNRPGGAERCADPAVPKSGEGDLALLDSATRCGATWSCPWGRR